jgi:2,3-bisphosphoglycerate-independent phosphoglycerate mutase
MSNSHASDTAPLAPCKSIPQLAQRAARGPLLICVMDGVGVGKPDSFNAVHSANAPTLKRLMNPADPRYRTVRAHGISVGLPSDEDMGNSEVGHNALGAGRIILQGASLVDEAIAKGAMWAAPGWAHLKGAWAKGGTMHFIGLLSDGGVHSRTDQLYAMIRRAAADGARRIRVHPLLDGRDVPEGTSAKFVAELEAVLAELRAGAAGGAAIDARIASGGGRMFVTMDRYNSDWKIVERGWHTHVLGRGRKFASAAEALATLRREDAKTNDQYMPPFVIADPASGEPVGAVADGDAVLLFNFRGDRMIQISRAFEDAPAAFKEFDRVRVPKVSFAGLMLYDGDLSIPRTYLVPPPQISHTSGEFLARAGVRVFACSETQKYGHVTYFWNGNRSGKFDDKLETYLEIPSDPTSVFADKPEMKAAEIAAAAEQALRSGKYDIVRINIANGDMVGHTGVLPATVRAVEAVDRAVAQLIAAVDAVNGTYLITADHGNADDMVQRDKKGAPLKNKAGVFEPRTSHTLAPVPLFIGGRGLPAGIGLRRDLPQAGLANITATFINLAGFEAPAGYEPSLLQAGAPLRSKL